MNRAESSSPTLARSSRSVRSGNNYWTRFLSVIDELTAQIEAAEERIEEVAASLEAMQLLMMILGVSFYSSLLITSELGEIDRFDTTKRR